MHGAGAALGGVAAHVGAGQAQVLADAPCTSKVLGGDVDVTRLAVDLELDLHVAVSLGWLASGELHCWTPALRALPRRNPRTRAGAGAKFSKWNNAARPRHPRRDADAMNVPAATAARAPPAQIAQARHAVMQEGRRATDVLVDGWYDAPGSSAPGGAAWRPGQRPQQRVAFDVVPRAARCGASRKPTTQLVTAARPVLEQLGRAIASTPLLRDPHRRATAWWSTSHGADRPRRPRAPPCITRVGVDLSERASAPPPSAPRWPSCSRCGCTAASTSSTTPAATAAPARRCSAPTARCVGMLDLTGIDARRAARAQAPGGAVGPQHRERAGAGAAAPRCCCA